MKNIKYGLLGSIFAYSLALNAARTVPPVVAGLTGTPVTTGLEEKKEKAAKENFDRTATEDMWQILLDAGGAESFPQTLKLLTEALQNGANPNARHNGDDTPLTYLIKSSIVSASEKVALVKVLLINQANLLLADRSGELPIHLAAMHGYAALVELLLSQNAAAQVNALTSFEGYTPLMSLLDLLLGQNYRDLSTTADPAGQAVSHEAIRQRTEKAKLIADILIAHGADLLVRNKAGLDVISYAVQMVDSLLHPAYKTSLKLFIDYLKNKIDKKRSESHTALITSSPEIALSPPGLAPMIADYVISQSETAQNNAFNADATEDMWNSIHRYWSRENTYSPDARKELQASLQNGANPNARDANGNTVVNNLMKSTFIPMAEKVALLDMLLRYGASTLLHDNSGRLPLHSVLQPGNRQLVEILLSKNPEGQIDALNPSGDVPLATLLNHMGINRGVDTPELLADIGLVADLLIKNGADLSAKNRLGEDLIVHSNKLLLKPDLSPARKTLIQSFIKRIRTRINQLKQSLHTSEALTHFPPAPTNIIASYLAPQDPVTPAIAASVEVDEEE